MWSTFASNASTPEPQAEVGESTGANAAPAEAEPVPESPTTTRITPPTNKEPEFPSERNADRQMEPEMEALSSEFDDVCQMNATEQEPTEDHEREEFPDMDPTPVLPPDIFRRTTALPALTTGVTESEHRTKTESTNPADDPALLPPQLFKTTPLKEVISQPIFRGTPTMSTNKIFQTPSRSSQFVFLSDQTTVSTDLKRLQASTAKRRRHMTARIHDLDCHVASITTHFCEEQMNMDLALSDTMDRSVCQPLEASIERFSMSKEASDVRGPSIRSLEERLMKMDRQMVEHTYRTMSDAKRYELDSMYKDVHQEIKPGMRIEEAKSTKIESGIIRRYESVAGGIARNFHQESAARRAAFELTKEQVSKFAQQEDQRGDDVLQTIQHLRQRIRQERLDRQAADKRILDEIVQTTVTMKRALLAAVTEISN